MTNVQRHSSLPETLTVGNLDLGSMTYNTELSLCPSTSLILRFAKHMEVISANCCQSQTVLVH